MALSNKQKTLINSCPVLKEMGDVLGGSGDGESSPSTLSDISDLSTVDVVVTYTDDSTQTLKLVKQNSQ